MEKDSEIKNGSIVFNEEASKIASRSLTPNSGVRTRTCPEGSGFAGSAGMTSCGSQDLRPLISISHSPDADDIFMYYAVKFGFVGNEFNLVSEALDIQTLNELARENARDIVAISFALYPNIMQDYALLTCQSSFGFGYGPKLIKPKGKELKRNFRVALSGADTSNALIFCLKYPEARITYMNFLEIEAAVLEGRVDAGVLIHESILDFDERLEVEAELYDIWVDLAHEALPLPLGGMVISRSLPLTRALRLEDILCKAVELGVHYKDLFMKMLLERDLVRVDEVLLDKYLDMYADINSARLSTEQIKGLDTLFRLGFEGGFYKRLVTAKEALLPREYLELRFS